MERALHVSSRKTVACCNWVALLGEDERGRHARPGRKGMLGLLFVLTALGILLVVVIEVRIKCNQLPAQAIIPDTHFAASR
jgi:hypothetical protein